ncbi:MAG: SoxR reducing system RseC family protein [Bacteroidales bacterium]|jgi:sigma-E factor negative regulatory protein RseC|nr:SoxR reducing system RseC family protein [Bacteroidales bacterium]
MKQDCIEQTAKIIAVEHEEITVVINRKSACSSCHAKAACTSLDKKDHVLTLQTPDAHKYIVGEEVKIQMATSLGTKAVMIGFVLPTTILIVIIAVFSSLFPELNQGLIAIFALFAYVVYCLLLYASRHKLNSQFKFTIKK